MTQRGKLLTESDPLYWDCFACNVVHGQPCKTESGKRTSSHRSRHEAVRLWTKYGDSYEEHPIQQLRNNS